MSYKNCVLWVTIIVVFALGMTWSSAVWFNPKLPSAYDTHLPLDQAFKTAKTPLLVEFYSDTCSTCQKITPSLHQLAPQFKQKLQFVMVNVDDPANQMAVKLFGVNELPALFVFDAKKMKKHPVNLDQLLALSGSTDAVTREALSKVLEPLL